MPSYAALVAPTARRAYGEATASLAVAEVEVCGPRLLAGPLAAVRAERLGGLDYVRWEGPPPSDDDLGRLFRLSFVLALFAEEGGALRPIEPPRAGPLPETLVTGQHYPGKTNEHLTRLLVNLAAVCAETGRRPNPRLEVLDPVCGRGTSLSEALVQGHHATGVEREKRAVDLYAQFLKEWLTASRIKHTWDYHRVRQAGRTIAHRLDVSLAASRERARHDPQRLVVLSCDTAALGQHLRAGSFDLLVADLPYGAQHRSGEDVSGRSPGALEAAVREWACALRVGAGFALSWNRRLLSRERMVELLARAGFEAEEALSGRFAHRVDRGIHRDVVAGRRSRPV